MIALGGTIGTGTSTSLFFDPRRRKKSETDRILDLVPATGLFVGAGSALATGGPLGIWLGYTIMGLVRCYPCPYRSPRLLLMLLFRLLFLLLAPRVPASQIVGTMMIVSRYRVEANERRGP